MLSQYSKFIGCFTLGALCTLSTNVVQANPNFQNSAQQLPPTSGSLSNQSQSLPELKKAPESKVFSDPEEDFQGEVTTGPKVVVNTIRIEGARKISQSQLLQGLQEELGKKHDFSSLKQIAFQITRQYRDAGFFTAWAYLPAQSLENNELVIIVLEGNIEEIIIENKGRLKPAVTRRFLDRIKSEGSLKTDQLEKQLRLLNDLPGVKAKARLIPGEKLGGSTLKLATNDEPILSGNVSLDNLGNRYTNATRLGALIQSNNALGYGEYLQLRLASSKEGYRFGQLRAAAPIGSYGGQLSVGFHKSEYELLKEFRALGAEGENQQFDITYTHPWARSLSYNLNSSFSIKQATYQDSNNNLGQFTDREVTSADISIFGDYIDSEANSSRFSANLIAGEVSDDMLSAQNDLYNIQSDFSRLLLRGDHNRWLSEDWRLEIKAIAQFTKDNLNSSEKLLLAGPQAVRAYPQGEFLVDQGVFLGVEAFYQFNPKWLFSVFVEGAHGERYVNPLPGDINNERDLSGVGLGFQWRPEKDWYISLSTAWSTGSAVVSDNDNEPRIWAQFIWQY